MVFSVNVNVPVCEYERPYAVLFRRYVTSALLSKQAFTHIYDIMHFRK
jgi:hypothetical protein